MWILKVRKDPGSGSELKWKLKKVSGSGSELKLNESKDAIVH